MWLIAMRSQPMDARELGERILGTLVRDVINHPGTRVDLDRNRRLVKGLLVEPAVDRELHLDLGSVGDATGELRIPNRIAAACGEHEVGDADDLDGSAVEICL